MGFSETIVLDDKQLTTGEISGLTDSGRFEGERLFVRRLKAGDPAAFDELVSRYSREIYGLLLRIMKEHEEASDVTQEVFIRAFRSLKSFRGDSALRTWLYRIAINQSRSRYRWWKIRRKDKTVSLDSAYPGTDLTIGETVPSELEGPEERVIREEQRLALERAIDMLPRNFRAAVVLCDIQGCSYEEISSILGVNIGTVKSRISRGRRALRDLLKDI